MPNISTLAILIRQGNHPKMPIWDPQNEFSGIPWIGFLLALLLSFIGKPEFPGIFRHFLGEGFWGSQVAFSGEDEVDMSGSGEGRVIIGPVTRHPARVSIPGGGVVSPLLSLMFLGVIQKTDVYKTPLATLVKSGGEGHY